MKKFILIFTTLATCFSIQSFCFAENIKPSGNYCGTDDELFTNNPQQEFSRDQHAYTPFVFDKWIYLGEKNVCGSPKTIEEYYNQSDHIVTYTFTRSASHSTSYSVRVGASFHTAFNARMGFSASNTVERTSGFTVKVKPNSGIRLSSAPSISVINGKWSYMTGSKNVEVYYPTHLTWLTSSVTN